jgi:hypothetical protein
MLQEHCREIVGVAQRQEALMCQAALPPVAPQHRRFSGKIESDGRVFGGESSVPPMSLQIPKSPNP